MKSVFLSCCLLLTMACSGADSTAVSSEPWQLLAAESRVSFVTIKAADIAEAHYFTDLKGEVGSTGKSTIIIGLDSVETNIDIRNQRLREILFETNDHPNAAVTAHINLNEFVELEVGARVQQSIEFTLDLHGVTADIETAVIVTRLDASKVAVDTVDPIILSAEDFNLNDAVLQLKQLASLPSISLAVPVTVSLVFAQ